ncbi:hypothetical protein BC938DRAFT_474294 [Jimgerdemannia flammicorona]|uniref:SET domain-containing protein n=1 Tax=Jimgerdemannia flammicorona TaxID=994334 RepID=A0A433Q2E8_9FUNG|nr:hypothetical protein BC938DRAFT_474294 [Jimgerdemannia flammicorona]
MDPFELLFEQLLISQQGRRLSRHLLFEKHKRSVAHIITEQHNDIINASYTVTDSSPHSAKTPLDSLKRITLSELCLDTVHHGRVLVCRNIVKPFKMNAVQLIVEDPIVETGTGNSSATDSEVVADRLSLYNFVNFVGWRSDVSDCLPVGARLLIKEPYYKMAADKFPMVRCDNPGDVIILSNEQVDMPLLNGLKWSDALKISYGPVQAAKFESSTPDQLRFKGNEKVKHKEYASAIAIYTQALALEPNNAIVLSNRAQAHLELQQFRQALKDADLALTIEAGNIKTRFRQAKALYGMKRYQEAGGVLRDLLQANATNTGIQDTFRRTLERIVEQQFGRYKVLDVFQEARLTHPPRLDHADYVGPVHVVQVAGKGRGIVATQDVRPGTLLMCSKAYAIVFKEELAKVHIRHIDDLPMHKNYLSKTYLITKIAHRVQQEPWTTRELYDLYAGVDLPPFIDQNPEIEGSQIDMARIEGITLANCFKPDNDSWKPFAELMVTSEEDEVHNKLDGGAGLWILPSYINHSCVANAHPIIIGDLMFIRAFRDIAKDEEVCISYFPLSPYQERKERLQPRKFDCQCPLCEFERSEPAAKHTRRHQLLEDFGKLVPKIGTGSADMIPRVESIVSDLRKTYPSVIPPKTEGSRKKKKSPKVDLGTSILPQQFRLALINPLDHLGRLYLLHNHREQALQVFLELFGLMPRCGDMVQKRMGYALAISSEYEALGLLGTRNQWVDVSKKESELMYGEDEGEKVWAYKHSVRMA